MQKEKTTMNLTPQQIKMVKSQGFLNSKDGTFAVRVITVNGVLTANQMKNLVEVAEKYGNGKLSFTSRLTVEIPGIKFQDIPAVKAHVAKEVCPQAVQALRFVLLFPVRVQSASTATLTHRVLQLRSTKNSTRAGEKLFFLISSRSA